MRLRLGLFLAISGVPLVAASQDAPVFPAEQLVWRHASHQTTAWHFVTSMGTLLLETDSALTSLDLATGAVQWTRTDLVRLPDTAAWFNHAIPYLLIETDTSMVVVDLASGATRWDRTSLPFTTVYGHVFIPERHLLLVAGRKAEGAPITVAGLDLDSGLVRWQTDSLLPMSKPPKAGKKFLVSPAQPAFLDSDTTAVLLPESGGLLRLDTRSGRLLWRQTALDEEDPPSTRWGYSTFASDAGVLYAPAGRRIYAIRLGDGSVLWKHEREYKAVVAQMALVPQGLFLRLSPRFDSKDGESFVDLVDPATGLSRWPKPIKSLDGATPFILRDGVAYLSAHGHWMGVDVAGDSVRNIGPIDFQGDEIPWGLEELDSGFLLWSSQNLLALAPNGAIRWSVYHRAPGASLLSQIAKGVLTVAIDVASVSAVRATGGGMAPVLYPSLGARYRASVNADRYMYMYTRDPPAPGEDGGYWLDKIDKTTGEVVGWIKFADRHPQYEIDRASGLVLVRVDAEGTNGPGVAVLKFKMRGH